MDFFTIKEKVTKEGAIELYPDFKVARSKDLMIRGRKFYAVWDEVKGLWSTDEYDVQRLVDEELWAARNDAAALSGGSVRMQLMSDFSSGSWSQFQRYVGLLSDASTQLDSQLTFANTVVQKSDHVSKRLPYSLESGDYSAWDEIISTLYEPSERAKLEWAIGAVVSGDSRHIQKFIVLYGPPGSGKGTIINIIQKLFEGYYGTFEAKTLASNGGAFAMEAFRNNPMVAIQHDGDLSKIEDNARLNSIISHEIMTFNEKFKPQYDAVVDAFLFMGTNKAVKISDAKSGIIRRLIDVVPSGRLLSARHYQTLMSQIDFELGAIAQHCLETYREMGKHFYRTYRPTEMILQTDVFYNFIHENLDLFMSQDGTTLSQAYSLYKLYCEDTKIEYVMPQYRFREELRNYFRDFEERAVVDGARVRSWYSGFITDSFALEVEDPPMYTLTLEETESLYDILHADRPAQYATSSGVPLLEWDDVTTTLKDLDTTRLHYVRVPEQEITIDFDLKDEAGNKSLELNLEAASKWPPTYGELSQGGAGVHLAYNYVGDVHELGRIFGEGIEVKVFTGKSSLRRRLSKANNIPVATLNGGLPLKEKKMLNADQVKSERSLRELIARNLRKEIMPGTKPSMDFIKKILDDAYQSDLQYDVTDMRQDILQFATGSSHQALYCIKLINLMKFRSEEVVSKLEEIPEEAPVAAAEKPEVVFDVEVFPNLFVICWKVVGEKNVVRMINPTAREVEELLSLKLVGFNNRRYDNHIIYAAFMGYNNEQLYKLSQKIISGTSGALFGEAYDLSYADIYDYSSAKKGLKKWEIELGIPHKELGLPWDEPVPEEKWEKVVDYCVNDVEATEDVFVHLEQDFVARKILADMSKLKVNNSTLQHTAKIIFQGDRRAKEQFVYTDLSKRFPGYIFDMGKSEYRGEDPSEGGYVYAEPGMYTNVAVLDVASMHPTSMKELNIFGDVYTRNFVQLLEARVAIKRKNYDEARKMLGGILAPYLGNEKDAKQLSYALKIVINIVYGLTSAKFENPFKDNRNVDNIVAKRGALFMIDLKHAVQEKGFTVAHIKTDSIKIPDATPEIIKFVSEFGAEYGYEFEHEHTYEKFCLVNDAVYVAKIGWSADDPSEVGTWEATGAQFQHPFVYKSLFSKEPIVFRDTCEAKFVTSALYLDFDEKEAIASETEIGDTPMALDIPESQLHFVGKAGLFTPVKPGAGGGQLLREKDGKYSSATGAKGYRWMESDMVEDLNKHDEIDLSYFTNLVDKAVDNISRFGDFEWFTSNVDAEPVAA